MTQNVYPALRCKDAPAIIEWMTGVLGFQEITVHRGDDGTVHHAELAFEGGVVMLGSASDGTDGRMEGEFGPSLLYLATENVDGLHERRRRPGPRSAWSSPTRTMARATSP